VGRFLVVERVNFIVGRSNLLGSSLDMIGRDQILLKETLFHIVGSNIYCWEEFIVLG
jgi:hypothetical protein